MTRHKCTVDEENGPDGIKFAAFCTNECGWASVWFWASDHDGLDENADLSDPASQAWAEAVSAGELHVEDQS